MVRLINSPTSDNPNPSLLAYKGAIAQKAPMARPESAEVATASGAKPMIFFRLLLARSGMLGWLRLLMVMGSSAQQLRMADTENSTNSSPGLSLSSC